MKGTEEWAVGIDLGGTKVEVARVDAGGTVRESVRVPTRVQGGPAAIIGDITEAIAAVTEGTQDRPVAVGVGTAGQIDAATGLVRFSPNLNWHDVPLRRDLEAMSMIPVVVTNDVRAITWGEWVHGSGRGLDDLICLFVGTGIGGGVVSAGRILLGCTNTAGEVGHMTIEINGPVCTCGNRGCLEAMAGGWAIARRAQQIVAQDPEGGRTLLNMAGSVDAITAETVALGANVGDPLSLAVLDYAAQALIAGAVSLVNAFDPCGLILGGGVVDGIPMLIDKVREGVMRRALPAATASLKVCAGELGSSAGVIGAASLALRTFGAGRSL